MRVVAINAAEAVIESYWDGGSSEHPTDKYSLLEEYTVHFGGSAAGSVRQTWFTAEVMIDKGIPGELAVILQRKCDISVKGYDIFRLVAQMPGSVHITVRAKIDGAERILMDKLPGTDGVDELESCISGNHLTDLQMGFTSNGKFPVSVNLFWLGLSNREAQERMESRKSPYTPEWLGILEKTPRPMEPELGIFFNQDGLEEIRKRIDTEPLKALYSKLKELASEDMALIPETYIGEFVPHPISLFTRKRDMKKPVLAGRMERLAFVGMVEGNREMSLLAARMAISAAHCEYWANGIMGTFPGTTWHHRSFTESEYCRGCALVLDWAGFLITPHGKQLIRDAMIMKGFARIESDFKRMEYMRSMNQGIVFSAGRIIGLLSLLPVYPRYRGLLEEAEKDLMEMIDSYVLDDGGTLEGMTYWNFTFYHVVQCLYALAHYHGVDLKEYTGGSVMRTGNYPFAMLSVTGDGATYLPINDASTGSHITPYLAAFFSRISDRPEWKGIYKGAINDKEIAPDIYTFIVLPDAAEESASAITSGVTSRLDALPDTGQVSSVRLDPELGPIHFHLCSGPTQFGHFHEDKGSFILEAGGEVLAADRASAPYEHSESMVTGFAGYHNLLYPESSDGLLLHQPDNVAGGKLITATEVQGILRLSCDNRDAWDSGLFIKNIRSVVSPLPALYVIDDEIEMGKAMAMSFRINTDYPVLDKTSEVWVRGSQAILRIVPVNWIPSESIIGAEGINEKLEPVNLIRMLTKPSKTHRLLTVLQVVPRDPKPEQLWKVSLKDNNITAARGETEIIIKY